MMLLAFASIYFITYKNVHSDIDMELGRLSEFSHEAPQNPILPQFTLDRRPPNQRSLSFVLMTDNKWNTIMVSSIFDMDKNFCETAKNAAIAQKAVSGQFRLYGNYWAYMIKPYLNGYRIVFLDVSFQQGILKNLVYTFLLVALVMLFFIFIISRFFANKAIQPVQEAFDRQRQFIADASHELKTPLAVINTNVDVLLSNDESNISEQSKWLHYIKSEVERMTKLTNDLLYLAQLDYSDIRMIHSDFDLSEAVEGIVLAMEAVIYEKRIAFSHDIEPGLKIHGSSEQIKQVVMILLDNAVKYTNSKGTIGLKLKRYYNNVVLSVTNTGEGIPEEHAMRVFDRFYRTDKARGRRNGSYGLGLSIAKAIVEQHRGRISVKSIVNESTTFSVELPLAG
jgi:signal transduction histidine kinase